MLCRRIFSLFSVVITLFIVFYSVNCDEELHTMASIQPTCYNLSILIDMSLAIYFVTETIFLDVTNRTSSIVLNVASAYRDRPYEIRFKNGTKIIPIDASSYNNKTDSVKIIFHSPIEVGNAYKLNIFFKGFIHRTKGVLVLDSQRQILTTNFETNRPFNFFPCFDDPEMRAKVSLKTYTHENFTVFANMPAKSRRRPP